MSLSCVKRCLTLYKSQSLEAPWNRGGHHSDRRFSHHAAVQFRTSSKFVGSIGIYNRRFRIPCVGDSRAAQEVEVEEKLENSGKQSEGAPSFKCLTNWTTEFNNIVILEAPENSTSQYAGCRILLLDNSGNVHSIYRRDSAWTGSYWDEFATLPPIIPPGPIAILGLGGGTAARLILELWPKRILEGYEIDPILVDNAREYLALSDLEVTNSEGGCLNVHVADAFSVSATTDGGFAGIVVDLFSQGEVLPELQQSKTWLELKKRLRPGGRIMVNCGGICVEKSDPRTNVDDGTWTWEDGGARKDATLTAMALAFPDELNWRRMESTSEADNVLALTGTLPDLVSWAQAVPERLKQGASSWKPY